MRSRCGSMDRRAVNRQSKQAGGPPSWFFDFCRDCSVGRTRRDDGARWRLQASRRVLLECTSMTMSISCAPVAANRQSRAFRCDDHARPGHTAAQCIIAAVWAQGGIGPHTIGACFVAGCAGVVLDVQFALARESTLPEAVKTAIGRMGGDETLCLGTEIGDRYRVYSRPGLRSIAELQGLDAELSKEAAHEQPRRALRWRDAIGSRINWQRSGAPLWPLGQDAALAAPLARRFQSVSGMLHGLRESLTSHVEIARALRPLDRGARSRSPTAPSSQSCKAR